jgi:hypothetical protein
MRARPRRASTVAPMSAPDDDVRLDAAAAAPAWWSVEDPAMDRRSAALRRAGDLADQQERIHTLGELLEVARFLIGDD